LFSGLTLKERGGRTNVTRSEVLTKRESEFHSDLIREKLLPNNLSSFYERNRNSTFVKHISQSFVKGRSIPSESQSQRRTLVSQNFMRLEQNLFSTNQKEISSNVQQRSSCFGNCRDMMCDTKSTTQEELLVKCINARKKQIAEND